MAHLNIPVTKIKTPWLRRLVIVLTLPFVLLLRVLFTSLGLLACFLDVLLHLGEDLSFTCRGAASVWRNATRKTARAQPIKE